MGTKYTLRWVEEGQYWAWLSDLTFAKSFNGIDRFESSAAAVTAADEAELTITIQA